MGTGVLTGKDLAYGGSLIRPEATGYVYDPDGVDREKLAFVKHLVFVKRGDIDAYVERFPSASFQPASAALGHNPLWSTDVDVALPCATQNELNGADANHLI